MGRVQSKSRWEDAVPASLKTARRLLQTYGYDHRASSRELIGWLTSDTPYPNPPNDALVRNPYLVLHEVVEIAEVRRMGLRITKDVIVKNMERVNDAHLTASMAEFDVAARDGALDHLRSRHEDLKSWCKDPLLTSVQRKRYEAFRAATERRLRTAESR